MYAPKYLWAPNGQRLAVIYQLAIQTKRLGSRSSFWTRRPERSTLAELFRHEPSPKPTALDLLAWSPDSTKLAVWVGPYWRLASEQLTVSSIGAIRIFDVNAAPNVAPLEIPNIEQAVGLSALKVHMFGQTDRYGFSPDGKTFFFASPVNQGMKWASSNIESFPLEPPTKPTVAAAPGTPPRPSPASPPAQARAVLFKHTGRISELAIILPKPTVPFVPDLPLVIPVAALEGTLKEWLTEKKQDVLRQLQIAKDVTAKRQALSGDAFDSIALLQKWYDGNYGALYAERKARDSAEWFFKGLAGAYNRMSETERATVEKGLFDRALALRRYRTVQRGIIREKGGLGTIASPQELDRYYTAVSRATWAVQELEALVRMSGLINTSRVALYGGYDAYEVSDPQPDAKRVTAIEQAQRRHFEALVDMGIVALLASEAQFEAVMDARKDRLYGTKEWWKDTKQDFKDPFVFRKAEGLAVQVLSLGFNFFDVVGGMGADALKSGAPSPVKGGLYYVFGAEFQTRAQKLERTAMDNWDKTQRKLLLLRLLKARTLPEVRALAVEAARGVRVRTSRSRPGKSTRRISKTSSKIGRSSMSRTEASCESSASRCRTSSIAAGSNWSSRAKKRGSSSAI